VTDSVSHSDARAVGFRTFLIADVRGYTTYTREHGDEAAAKLAADFAAAVRDVVTERDGFLLELRGDEALVVFESPRQALRAAVALQAKFKEIALPRGVGIGLDAGEAIPIEGGYRGGALNLAARLCSQASAGEILASEAVIHLAARIEGVEYVEPRTLHLKGYAEPVRAVEVAAPGKVRTGLSRRARRIRVSLRHHRRAISIGVAALLLGAAGIAILLRPPQAPARAATLADLPSGIALIDTKTGKEVGHVGSATIKAAVDATYSGGYFWVVNLEPLSLIQVDAETGGIVRQIAAPFPDMGGFVTDGKSLWIADYAHPAIARIDIGSGREVERLDLKTVKPADEGFAGLALGEGSIWASGKSRGQIFRIDPDTGTVQAKISVAESWAETFADGVLWTGSFDGVAKIDSATNTAAETDVPSGYVATSIAVGGGFAWTANEAKGVVYKIDRGGRVVATVSTGIGARGVSFGDGKLWVGNQDVGTASGIDAVTGNMTTLEFGHPVASVAAGAGKVLVVLDRGKTYEDRIDALSGKVARILVSGYEFGDPADFATSWTREAFMIANATCPRLLNWARTSGGHVRLEPDVATGPPISADGRTVTFQIRPGFAFSDESAEKVTAETFRYSIERALSPKLTENPHGTNFLNDIEGFEAFEKGSAAHISGLVAKNDRLTITLVEPRGDLAARLAIPFFCPVPLGTPIVAGGVVKKTNGPDGTIESIPSAGPYYVADALNGEYVILKKNPNYGGSRKASFDSIALREGLSGGIAVDRVDSGRWDGIVDLYDQIFSPGGELAMRWGPGSEAAKSADQRFHIVPDGGLWALSFNASRPPLNDIRIRQAVSLAINRVATADSSGSDFNQVIPWNHFLGPPMLSDSATPSADELKPDPARARAMLGAGVKRALILRVPNFCDECHRAAERIASDLKAVGLEVQVLGEEEGSEGDPFGNADLRVGAAWPDTPDRGMFLTLLFDVEVPQGWLPKALLGSTQRLAKLNGDEREQGVDQLEALADKQVPAAIYGYSVMGAYFRNKVSCIEFWPDGELNLAALCPAS
jgi:ABC-type transport system substrate-binding protein/class 3 adenylate cyclase